MIKIVVIVHMFSVVIIVACNPSLVLLIIVSVVLIIMYTYHAKSATYEKLIRQRTAFTVNG